MSKLRMQTTKVFSKNLKALKDPNIRFIVNQGGTRSSKTYSIIQLLVWYAITNRGKMITIARHTRTNLIKNVLPDLKDVLESMGILDAVKADKTSHEYRFPTGSVIRFIGIYPDVHRLRGMKHDLVFINEADSIDFEAFSQINWRTTGGIILDFNPSDPYSWIFDVLLGKEKFIERTIKIHSTFKDNPFLPKEQVEQIENLKYIDPAKYEVFTLGKPPIPEERVFTNVKLGEFPDYIDYVYGLDFGLRDPNALVKVGKDDTNLYVQEIYYKGCSPDTLINDMLELEIEKNIPIHCDSARPDIIDMLVRAGFGAQKSNKKIEAGLDFMNNYNIVVEKSSENAWKEFRSYSYKKLSNGRFSKKPVDWMNHSIDAARYAAMGLNKGNFQYFRI